MDTKVNSGINSTCCCGIDTSKKEELDDEEDDDHEADDEVDDGESDCDRDCVDAEKKLPKTVIISTHKKYHSIN